MKSETGEKMEARLVGYVLVVLVLVGGCTPRNVHWRDTTTTVQPQEPRVEMQEEPRGYLVIAVPPNVGQPDDEELQHYPPVYLYDQKGNYLKELPNNTEYPTALLPGEYIVLIGQTDPLGEFHQVQVRVEGGKTTAVALKDVERAPEFWELSRELFN